MLNIYYIRMRYSPLNMLWSKKIQGTSSYSTANLFHFTQDKALFYNTFQCILFNNKSWTYCSLFSLYHQWQTVRQCLLQSQPGSWQDTCRPQCPVHNLSCGWSVSHHHLQVIRKRDDAYAITWEIFMPHQTVRLKQSEVLFFCLAKCQFAKANI